MKGIILSGGTGSRLYPLTIVTNKQLIPVYDKPMIYYPLTTLIQSGIRDICIISSPSHIGLYKQLFKDGSQMGLNIVYREQPEPKGLAEAFIIAEDFIDGDSVCLILGDNVFHGSFEKPKYDFNALIYGYRVKDPRAYGVVELSSGGTVISIEEKPTQPKSNYAIPGLYYFDKRVVEYSKLVKPSSRGELEITDIMRRYMKDNELKVIVMSKGTSWLDAGTPQSLFQASAYVQAIQERAGIMIGCIEESSYKAGFITTDKYKQLIDGLPNSEYRSYLEGTIE